MAHSNIVGGSTAVRVINCPGSVKLCQKVPKKPSSKFADEGTLLHTAIEQMLMHGKSIKQLLGLKYEDQVLTQELADEMLVPAFNALEVIDPTGDLEFECEVEVNYGDLLPGVFGTTDVLGKIGKTAVVADWKFGRGHQVEAEENYQLMFYAAAAMRTEGAKWAFEGVDTVKLAIIQPAYGVSHWDTTIDRIKAFEDQLVMAVKASEKKEATIKAGDHCLWCQAKPICPVMTRAVDRAIATDIKSLDALHINAYLKNADLLEVWIKDIRELAHQMLENDAKLEDWKLVAKRATRKWAKEEDAKAALLALGLEESEVTETFLLSPAQVEKVLKKRKIELPEAQVVSVSTGSTLARKDDPRPEVLNIGKQLSAALSQIV